MISEWWSKRCLVTVEISSEESVKMVAQDSMA